MEMRKSILVFIAMAITALMVCCSNQQNDTPKDHKTETVFPKGEKIVSNNFTGTVWLNMMGVSDTSLHIRIGNVTFEPKARTNWHSHPGGQILFVTKGQGYYQAQAEPVKLLRKGDVVEIPRNIVHWHGAGPENEFVHIAVSLNTHYGSTVWSRPVTNEEYQAIKQFHHW